VGCRGFVTLKGNGKNGFGRSRRSRRSFFVFGFQHVVVSSNVSLSSQPSRDGSQLAVPGRLLFFRVKSESLRIVV
jgi:hypothetical protein